MLGIRQRSFEAFEQNYSEYFSALSLEAINDKVFGFEETV
jgi:hypothetical protein